MADEEEFDDEDSGSPESAARFPVRYEDELGLKAISFHIRSRLRGMAPSKLRSAAAGLLALESLPAVTAGVDVSFSFSTRSVGGNWGWADIGINEYEFKLGLGEHFYDPDVGGDTESRTVFEAQSGSQRPEGDIDSWLTSAADVVDEGELRIEDNSAHEAIDWGDDPAEFD